MEEQILELVQIFVEALFLSVSGLMVGYLFASWYFRRRGGR